MVDQGFASMAHRVKELGFDVIEVPLERIGDLDAPRVSDLLAEEGLSATVCAAMSEGRSLVSDSQQVLGATSLYLRGCIEFAERIGASVVGGALYAPVGRGWHMKADERERCYERLAENLRGVADYAGERGVRLALEALNRFETSVVNTVAQAMEVVERVDSPALGVMADTFHMNIEERSVGEALRLAGDRLVHVQVCGNDRGSPGRDHIDWTEMKDALVGVGYGGAVCIESFAPDSRTFADAVSIWRPLAPSQDALAADGLRFLRELFAT